MGEEVKDLNNALSAKTANNVLGFVKQNKTVNGATISCDGLGRFTLSNTAINNGGRTVQLTNLATASAGTYSFNVESDDTATEYKLIYIINDSNNTQLATITGSGYTSFTLESSASIYFGINVNKNHPEYNCTAKIRLEIGNNALPFIPSDSAIDYVAREEINAIENTIEEIDGNVDLLLDYVEIENLFTQADYEQGTLTTVGATSDSIYRIRLKNFYIAPINFKIKNKPGYTVAVFWYTYNGAHIRNTGYPSSDTPTEVVISKGDNIKIVISKYPNAETTTAAYSQIEFTDASRIDLLDGEIEIIKENTDAGITMLKDNAIFFESEVKTFYENAYYVGINRNYQTINAALTAWAGDNYPPAVVYIENGEYNETILVEDKTIAFVGESKEGTIIRTKTGAYIDAPILVRHGNVLLENITFIADHSDNPSFDYTGSTSTFAYGIHIDGGSVGGVVIVRNCKAVSYQSPAFGMGLIPGSKIRLEDVDAYCYTDAGHSSATNYGCILCHLASPTIYPSEDSQTFEMVNVRAYAKNTNNVIYLNEGSSSQTMQLKAIGVITISGLSEDQSSLVRMPTNYNLNAISGGNTCPKLNN